MMRVFAAGHGGIILGGVSIVVAEDEAAARVLLEAELLPLGIRPDRVHPISLREIDLSQPAAIVLYDGDY